MPGRLRLFLFGPPKDVKDPDAFHKLSLVALLAWVGLGADGLSSSAYGPEEAFRALGEHTGMAFFLAIATAATVFIISYGYSHIIEQFPSGGGGYVVASKLLSPRVGVVSGAALLVDYVLTITISIASGADAIFSFLPPSVQELKLPAAVAGVALLTVMNIRGVKESVTALVPVFTLFVVTHAIMLIVALGGHAGDVGQVSQEVRQNIGHTTMALGAFGALKLLVHAYSMGGGTYTGIEAVSNGVAMMREPRVRTAKRTMVLMATSLAVTAGGIVLAYLLVHARPEDNKTMNAVLLERVAGNWTIGGFPFGRGFVIAALLSEGALLFVAAQAGFLDGPRVMANMATDSWLPHRFAALSDRLSMRNGINLMAIAAFAALFYTHGDVSKLVVMYSINVFLTFSLSNLAMARFWVRHRREHAAWVRPLFGHAVALALCATILVITTIEKFAEGGWVTLLGTALVVAACFAIKRHYSLVVQALRGLDNDLPSPPEIERAPLEVAGGPARAAGRGLRDGRDARPLRAPRVARPRSARSPSPFSWWAGTAASGRHALLTLLRMFPNHFGGVIFVSVAVVDSESFKGADQIAALEQRTRQNLLKYERYAHTLELNAASAFADRHRGRRRARADGGRPDGPLPQGALRGRAAHLRGRDVLDPDLHNETAFMVQKRLQRMGLPMIVVPVRVALADKRAVTVRRLAA